MPWTGRFSARLRSARMVAVVWATMHAREASPMAQPMSVLRIDMAPWVLHVVGMGDTGAVVLRKRLARGGHQWGRRHGYPMAWCASPA